MFLLFAAAVAKLPDISASDISAEGVPSDTSYSLPVIDNLVGEMPNAFNYSIEESPEIWDFIQSAFEVTAKEDNSEADDHRYVATSQTVVQDSLSLFSDTKYELHFVNKGGEDFMYTLEGNVLTDVATKEKVTLSSERAFELLTKLGIIIVWEDEE